MPLSVIVLAAGQGKRMVSDLPKVLHTIGGLPLLAHVLNTADQLAADRQIIVIGHGGEQVKASFAQRPHLLWAEQPQQLGTGHAVAQALPLVEEDDTVLVLYGDVPLIRATTLTPLIETARNGGLGLLTAKLPQPKGYGRIVRHESGQVMRIVEERDASPAERQIHEINTGILAAPARWLTSWVAALNNDNAQGEYYLTDVVAMAVIAGVAVEAVVVADADEPQGVNNRSQQAAMERYYQRRRAAQLMEQGVTLLDPNRIDIRGEVTVGRDVVIDIDVILSGRVELGDRVQIGAHSILQDATIQSDSVVLPHTLIESANLGQRVTVGPYARLRPGTELKDGARVGNFVEIKKSQVGLGSKINHLSYIGDTLIGAHVNVGAGTITCNYDGANKHQTTIADGAFIGSNTALVAPVRVGLNATVGAGSTISRDVPDEALALTRPDQRTIANWARHRKG